MNSFALLQDDVEDDGATVTEQSQEQSATDIPAEKEKVKTVEDVANGASGEALISGADDSEVKGNENGDQSTNDAPEKERDLTFDEYQAQKAALSNAMTNLNVREARRANDGQEGFEKMSMLKKKNDRAEGMSGVAVKEMQESKGLKDNTHAAVARNAEIQKFFQRDPNEKRPFFRGRGRGGDRGRGRGGVERGRGGFERGRGGFERGRGSFERGRGGFERGRGGSERGRGGFDRGGRGGYERGGRGGYERGGRGGFERGSRGGYERGGRGGFERGGRGGFERGGRGGSEYGGRGGSEYGGRGGSEYGGRGGSEYDGRGGSEYDERGGSEYGGRGGSEYGGRGGSEYGGRGGSERGRGRGRGGFRDNNHDGNDKSFPPQSSVVNAPNFDDTTAFPSL